MIDAQKTFIALVQLGIGHIMPNPELCVTKETKWKEVITLSSKQGLSAIVLDGVERLPEELHPPKDILLQWIGEVMQGEQKYVIQWNASREIAILLSQESIGLYVLKGPVISECYPIPNHRVSVDLDCFLKDISLNTVAWEIGNTVVENKGYRVERDYYKNSTWYLPGLTVENHRWLTPFRGNKRLTALERVFQSLLLNNDNSSFFMGTKLYRPPVMVSALFLIEHAYSHFLHEGLTWRHVLDWMMFSRMHKSEIDWVQLEYMVDKFGFRRFYDSFYRLGVYLLGEVDDKVLERRDLLILNDIWSDLDIHDTVRGWRGKLNLAGNTWRARWKYRWFSDMTWVHALWIQVMGFLFFKHPRLK